MRHRNSFLGALRIGEDNGPFTVALLIFALLWNIRLVSWHIMADSEKPVRLSKTLSLRCAEK